MSERDAVFLIGFGGPERQEEVRPFIENIVRGRNVPKERIDMVVDQYATIGGRSPYNELTLKQAQAIEKRLQAAGSAVPLFVGMLYSRPTIENALADMQQQGIERAVGLILAPHRSEASFEKYKRAVEDAGTLLTGNKPHRLPAVDYVDGWHTHPLFIAAIADRVCEQLSKLDEQTKAKTRIIFTAHSIPQEMSDRSGYASQIAETAAAVYAELCRRDAGAPTLEAAAADRATHGVAPTLGAQAEQQCVLAQQAAMRSEAARLRLDWTVGYQSRSGPPQQKWLEPDVISRAEKAKAAGKTHVIATPVGFLVDHVEVLYDLDVLAAEGARQAGITMLRAATVGDHPQFIELLTALAKAKIESFYARS